jgi:hypothetical protein
MPDEVLNNHILSKNLETSILFRLIVSQLSSNRFHFLIHENTTNQRIRFA